MIPLQVGRRHGAAAHEQLQFWILPFAFSLLLLTLLVPGGAPAGGWTLYPPLVLQTGDALPMAIFAVHLMGASSIMGSINVIVHDHEHARTRHVAIENAALRLDVADHRVSLIAVMPVLAGAVTMLLTDHFFAPVSSRRPADAGRS